MDIVFRAYLTLNIDTEENVLSIDEDGHEETVQQLIEDALYEIDGVKIKSIKVTQNE
tara:strand:- start:765 stop:935 length:171 start_codon:yes stop_codon:yes gene_type:complete